MKPIITLIVAAIAIGMTGCGPREPQVDENVAEGSSSKTNLETTTKNVTDEISEAMDSTIDLAKESKVNFVSTMKIKMNDLEQEVDQLAKKAETLEGDAKARTQEAVDRLKEKLDALSARHENFQAATGDAWKDMKAGFSQAYYEMEQAVKDAKEKHMESK